MELHCQLNGCHVSNTSNLGETNTQRSTRAHWIE